ncbi:MAG: glycosyltransferase [Azoarcus sp.]|jgi:glycosyltransferase involved in cell wall biosynthesis|nr:glycosyltransferase [Azoarcus sp.]
MSKTPDSILQVCYGYQSPLADCAGQYARLFRGTPYKVVTVQLKGPPDEKAEREMDSDEVIFLGYKQSEISNLKLRAIRDVRRIAASRDFAFCIAHLHQSIYTALFATRLMVIGVNHDFREYRRFFRRLYTNVFKKRLRLLGVSDAVRDSIRAALPRWSHDHIETLHNRMDLAAAQATLLPRESARALLGLPPQGWIVGCAGRLHPEKDHPVLIRAFAAALPALPAGSMLAIMGSGREEEALKALAQALGIQNAVRFLGQVDDGKRYFKAFDIFVLASEREPFGMVFLEAMAAHLPVVCSDRGGGREVVEGIGDLFPAGDIDALAQTLIRHSISCLAEDYATRAEAHMRQKFSDEVAATSFWRLPMMAAYSPSSMAREGNVG